MTHTANNIKDIQVQTPDHIKTNVEWKHQDARLCWQNLSGTEPTTQALMLPSHIQQIASPRHWMLVKQIQIQQWHERRDQQQILHETETTNLTKKWLTYSFYNVNWTLQTRGTSSVNHRVSLSYQLLQRWSAVVRTSLLEFRIRSPITSGGILVEPPICKGWTQTQEDVETTTAPRSQDQWNGINIVYGVLECPIKCYTELEIDPNNCHIH